jgi:hypothetical protein
MPDASQHITHVVASIGFEMGQPVQQQVHESSQACRYPAIQLCSLGDLLQDMHSLVAVQGVSLATSSFICC